MGEFAHAYICPEATDATNELINDDKVAPLTTEEIEALKLSGAHASVRKLLFMEGITV
jgi:hypothetical protein